MINLQSAAIPYRTNAQLEVEVLLVTSRKRGRWVLPKGRIKRGVHAHTSAAFEAFEEAGVTGEISALPVGTYTQMKVDGGGQTTTVAIRAFPLLVTGENQNWPEMRVRQRCWMSVTKALAAVQNTELRALLRKFADVSADYG